ncbi:Pet127-domain-containing protein [Xylona heveae TC161]|uniref:Pet127-domain-containing protein n=1 Tax=Xylona heveae (strain CBS 132557 / TC161) TaxID=1328760 RepID=A0A165FSG7_XYLHT|nr:Pet127-domain-containing protein [Xylona heveae TC161]KZF21321.1 Pet127-domain-containing protein [Xylona heveae TC161]
MFRQSFRGIASRGHGYICPSCRYAPLNRSANLSRFQSTVASAVGESKDAEDTTKVHKTKRRSKHDGDSKHKEGNEGLSETADEHASSSPSSYKKRTPEGADLGGNGREELLSTLKGLLKTQTKEGEDVTLNGDVVEVGHTPPRKQGFKRTRSIKGAAGRRKNGEQKLSIRRRPTRSTQVSKESPRKGTSSKAEEQPASEQKSRATIASSVATGATSAKAAKDKLISEMEGHDSLENALVGKLKRSSKKGAVPKRIQSIEASNLHIEPVEVEQPPVPGVAHGLERVLFNPGVYQLQDPRSRVFNFDPYLKTIMPVAEFDFNALTEYVTSSKDEALKEIAQESQKKYIGSSSSMTGALAHFHFLLSNWRPINANILSQGFSDKLRSFTMLQRSPSAIFLRHKDGIYAIDADKEFDSANILSMLGKSMEKLLTLPKEEYERYRITNSAEISEEERNAPEAFHYSTMGDFLMRSQLDAHDPRLPGTGMFDLKTRAVVSIRMDSKNYESGTGYQIRGRHGEWESYEREYFDMIRSAFLKYSLQVRMGRMDGIFVAFHNTQRIFGFQYVPLSEMDAALHGQWDTCLGDQEFKISINLLNQVLDRATQKFPGKSLRMHFEMRDAQTPFMYIFAEPVAEEQIEQIQSTNKKEIEEFERSVLGLKKEGVSGAGQGEQYKANKGGWEDIQAKVEAEVENDELSSDIPQSLEGNDSEMEQSEWPRDESPQATSSTEDKEPSPEQTPDIGASISVAAAHENLASQAEQESSAAQNISTQKPDEAGQPKEGQGSVQELDRKADIHFLDELSREQQEVAEEERELLAMTLTIRNKVNGQYVLRPENLGPEDRWSVEYDLAEIPTASRSWSLYGACQTRRRSKLEMQSDDSNEAANFFMRRIKELSEKGRIWRKQQDLLDEEIRHVLQ